MRRRGYGQDLLCIVGVRTGSRGRRSAAENVDILSRRNPTFDMAGQCCAYASRLIKCSSEPLGYAQNEMTLHFEDLASHARIIYDYDEWLDFCSDAEKVCQKKVPQGLWLIGMPLLTF